MDVSFSLFLYILPTIWTLAFSSYYDEAEIVRKFVSKLESVKVNFQDGDQGLRVMVNDGALYEANDPWIPGILLAYFDILDRELQDNNYSEKTKRLLIEETEDFWLERYLPIWENNHRRFRFGNMKVKDQKASAYELGETSEGSEREEKEGTTAWYLFVGVTLVIVLLSVAVAIFVYAYVRRKKKNYSVLQSASEDDDEDMVTRRSSAKSSRRQRGKTHKGAKEANKSFRY